MAQPPLLPIPRSDRDRKPRPYQNTSRRPHTPRGSLCPPRSCRWQGHIQSSAPCNPVREPRLQGRFFPTCVCSCASPALIFICSDNRTARQGSGSPILPTYCLFLLEREKSIACQRRE